MATSDNLVFQFTTGTGTGSLTLQDMIADSPAQYFRTFNSAFGNGATQNVFYYCIRHRTTLEWEVGTGHMSDATTLVRDTVLYSSNSNNAVNFSSGNKDVISDIPANLQGYLSGLTDNIQSQIDETIKELYQVSSTGLHYGGSLSVNADNTKFDISAGEVDIVDNHTDPDNPSYSSIEFTAQSAISVPSIADAQVSFIGIALDNTLGSYQTGFTATINGVSGTAYIIFQTSEFTSAQIRDICPLGRLIHPNLTSINAAANLPITRYNPHLTSIDGLRSIGTVNFEGNIYSGVSGQVQIKKSAGKTFRIGSNYSDTEAGRQNPNITTDAATNPTTVFHRYRNGSGGWSDASGTTTIQKNYDDNSGTPASLTANQWTIHRVGFFNNTGRAVVQLGQNTYANKAAAKQAVATESFDNDPNLADMNKRCFLLIRGGATDLSLTTDAEFIEFDKFSSTASGGAITSTTTLQQAYNNSTDPEITTDSTLGAVTIKRGSGADTDAIIEGKNAANTVTSSITGAGKGTFTALNASGETASTIAHFDSNKDVKSLATATYPSLTELSYVKGVTSAIQTQLNSHTAHDDILFYGDGSDGNVTISGSVTLTRDMFYNNLTITTGADLNPAGYRIFVKETLDLTAAPASGITRIGSNGSNATGSSGASAGGSNTGIHVGGGISGGSGGSSTSTNGNQGNQNANPANMIGGLAGNSGKGGDSASGTGGAAQTANDSGGNQWQTSFRKWTDFLARPASIYNAGSGGPGGSGGAGNGSSSNGGGGGGGGGGGVLWISAKTVTCTGAATAALSAKGGNGGNGRSSTTSNAAGGGGGAGAGGGFIFFAYKTLTGSAANIFSAAGGTGGNGGNGNGTGNGGDGGQGGDGGAILIVNMTAGTSSLTQGSAGSTSGTAASGTTGGTGAAGGSCVASL